MKSFKESLPPLLLLFVHGAIFDLDVSAFTSVKRSRSTFRAQRHIIDQHLRNRHFSVHRRRHIFLSAASKNQLEVSQVSSNEDIISLADLRYQEWMVNDDDGGGNCNGDHAPPPNLSNFRRATAEIYHERKAEDALVFLAKLNDGGSSLVVGAAELSPIELKGAIMIAPTQLDDNRRLLYVTDVVASSSHRRLGIGSKLMYAVEETVCKLGSQCICLHVEHNNTVARRFYERLGYVYVDTSGSGEVDCTTDGLVSLSLLEESIAVSQSTLLETETKTQTESIVTLNTHLLAENAGTVGQLVMMKRLVPSACAPMTQLTDSSSSTANVGGFGLNEQTKRRN